MLSHGEILGLTHERTPSQAIPPAEFLIQSFPQEKGGIPKISLENVLIFVHYYNILKSPFLLYSLVTIDIKWKSFVCITFQSQGRNNGNSRLRANLSKMCPSSKISLMQTSCSFTINLILVLF